VAPPPVRVVVARWTEQDGLSKACLSDRLSYDRKVIASVST
jgi:hypothetical protein